MKEPREIATMPLVPCTVHRHFGYAMTPGDCFALCMLPASDRTTPAWVMPWNAMILTYDQEQFEAIVKSHGWFDNPCLLKVITPEQYTSYQEMELGPVLRFNKEGKWPVSRCSISRYGMITLWDGDKPGFPNPPSAHLAQYSDED